MSLYLNYRPNSLEEIVGNEHIKGPLLFMTKNIKKAPHAYLFHGPTGCGKTTIGRILKDLLGAVGSDYREVDSGDFRGIDTVRDLRKNAKYKPLEGPVRVFLIDECHKLTNDAQNALLKILEDTPSHVYFILCTTDPQKLIGAVKNRCQQFQVDLLEELEMKRLLKRISKDEGTKLQREVLEQIVEDAMGHPRMAIQTLEQVLTVPKEKRLEIAAKMAEDHSMAIQLCRVLISPNPSWKKLVAPILNALKKQDAEAIRRQVLGYAQTVILKGDNDRAAAVLEEFVEPFYNSGFPGLVLACYSVVKS